MPNLRERIDAAIQRGVVELSRKTLYDIQVETALTWCGRACAAAAHPDVARRSSVDAHEYAHEAIEHAALSGNDDLLRQIRATLRSYGVEGLPAAGSATSSPTTCAHLGWLMSFSIEKRSVFTS